MPAMASLPVDSTEAPIPEHRPLAPDVFLTFATKVAIVVLGMLSTVIVARTLGPAGRGAIAVAFSLMALLVQFGSLGLQSANPYFVARNPRSIATVVLNTVWGTIGIGLVLAALALAAKIWFPASLRGLNWLDVAVVAVGVPALLAVHLLQSVFLAEGRMRVYNGVELAGSLAVFVGLLVGLTVLHIGVLGAIIVMAGANWAMTLAFLMLQRGNVTRGDRPDGVLLARMLKYGFRIYLTTLIAYLVGRVNLIVVDADLGTTQAGFYSVGVSLAEGMYLFPTVVAINLFPRIARGASFEHSAMVFRALWVLFGLLCLVTIPLAAPGITLVYGSRFAAAAQIYYWMLPGIFSYGMLNVLSYHFAGRGFPREAVLVWFPGLLINLLILAIFLPGHEPYVAALASTTAYVIVLVLHMRLFAKESGGYRVLLPRPRELIQLTSMLARGARASVVGRYRNMIADSTAPDA
jgi:O-antigen/teichoic acid export membrane protein